VREELCLRWARADGSSVVQVGGDAWLRVGECWSAGKVLSYVKRNEAETRQNILKKNAVLTYRGWKSETGAVLEREEGRVWWYCSCGWWCTVESGRVR